MQGFTTSGFLYLQNSGLSPVDAFNWSTEYFKLPVDVKAKHPNVNSAANRGYSGMGKEKVTNLDLDTTDEKAISALRSVVPDLKESLEMGSDPGRYPKKQWENHYPNQELPGFGGAMQKFYEACDDLHHHLLSALAQALGLDEDFFSRHVTAGDHVLRLIHYPAISKAILDKDPAVRAGSHTDYGTVTLLFQDMSGGLQVKTPGGAWLDIPPIKDAIVINAGTYFKHGGFSVASDTTRRGYAADLDQRRDQVYRS